MHAIGALALSAYVISAYATDISYHFLGGKPYLSWVAGIVTAITFLMSGTALRALKTTTGKLALGLMVWLLIDIPFSRWPGGSFEMMQAYIPKAHFVIFFSAALLMTAKQCRMIVTAYIIAACAILFTCFRYGSINEDGRMGIEDSIFFANPNDLALYLVISLGFWTFLISSPKLPTRISGLLGAGIAVFYLLKTGSRGSFIALAAILALWFILSKKRLQVLLFMIPSVAIILMIAPSSMLHRMSLLTATEGEAVQANDTGSVDSQFERQQLLRLSIKYTFRNPLFGVGPGQFSDAVWADYKKVGIHVASLSTHNGYTQISSECGLPAFFCFAGMIFLSIRNNFRLARRTSGLPQYELVSRIAFGLTTAGVAFAANLFFHHVGYTMYVASLTGLSIALELATVHIASGRTAPVRR